MMEDQTVLQDSKLAKLQMEIWRTNKQYDKLFLEHRLLLLLVIHHKRSLLEL